MVTALISVWKKPVGIMSKKVWNLMYVVGNPAMFTRVTSCADNPMSRADALGAAERVAGNGGGWRVWVEHHNKADRIFESQAEKSHNSALAAKRVIDFAKAMGVI